MSQNLNDFNRGVIKPVECLKEAWGLIKDQYWLFLGICAVGMLIGSAFAIALMGPMICGIYLCLFQRMRGEPVKFENLFKGLRLLWAECDRYLDPNDPGGDYYRARLFDCSVRDVRDNFICATRRRR